MTLVEAAVETLQSALAAERSGVGRIELCVNLGEGGTTPPAELISTVIAATKIPVVVLVRPRAGDFVYSSAEIETIFRDIEAARTLGIAGVITGALTASGRVAMAETRGFVQAAAGLPVTFHRAFDVVPDFSEAIEELIDIGIRRILTSAGQATALAGVDVIAGLVEQARGRIDIVAGGGIRESNVREIITRTRVGEVHSRFIGEPDMQRLVEIARHMVI